MGGGGAGDAPTWLVGIGGLTCLAVLMRIVKSRAARGLIAAAVALGIFALWVDLGTPPAVLARSEELYEVLAEGLFLCGLLRSRDLRCSRFRLNASGPLPANVDKRSSECLV
jgi:hypothetical protein